jgi:arylsulfatase
MPDADEPVLREGWMAHRQARQTLLWLLLALLAALGAYGIVRLWGSLRLPSYFIPNRPEVAAVRQASKRANVVVLVLDAVRADHVGCYGYPRDTTPNLDRLAKQSAVFEQHFCQFTRTKESTASLFTSQYADSHLAYRDRPLADSAFTIARGLTGAGFSTALFSSNFNASPALDLGRHFQEAYYDPQITEVMRGTETRWSPEPCLRLFGDWLDEHGSERLFAYIHLMPPHTPYDQPEEMTELFRGREPPGYRPDKYHPEQYDFPIEVEPHNAPLPLPEWINLYDANLRYGDWAVGETERLLKGVGIFEKTILIVTSDHGEAFGEHGFVWHGEPIHDEVAHIPLLIRFPGGRAAQRVGALTESIDLLPTIFDLFLIRYPEEQVQGRSLLDLVAGLTDSVRDYAFTRAPRHSHKYMMRNHRHSLLLWGNGRWRTLYDLAADPGQNENVVAEEPEVVEQMARAFEEFALAQRVPPLNFLDPEVEVPRLPPAKATRLAPEVKKALRDLGYL